MSQLDATLAPLQSGEDAGKIPVDALRQQLAIAKAELEAIELQLQSLNVDNASNVNDIAALGQQIFTIGQTITAIQTALNSKAETLHSHAIANVTGLQNALDGKQPAGSYATAAQGAKADTALQPAAIGSTVQGFDANTTKNNVSNNFTQPNEFDATFSEWTAETFNATQTLNANVQSGTTTLTGNILLYAVSNDRATGKFQIMIRCFTQDATGNRDIAYNTGVFSASGGVFPQPSKTPNSVSYLQFMKEPNGKWDVSARTDVRST